MAESYPASLQQTFSRGTFQRAPGNNVIYTQTDFGPSKSRRRTTLRKDLITGVILLKDNQEYDDFIDWFTSTLKDGTLSFIFSDPVTTNPIEVKFSEARFTVQDIGYRAYRVTMNLEVVNG